jgi:hypothetical protein
MTNFVVNGEEVVLLRGFRMLTTRQRQLILMALVSVTSATQQIAPEGAAKNVIPLHHKSKLIRM